MILVAYSLSDLLLLPLYVSRLNACTHFDPNFCPADVITMLTTHTLYCRDCHRALSLLGSCGFFCVIGSFTLFLAHVCVYRLLAWDPCFLHCHKTPCGPSLPTQTYTLTFPPPLPMSSNPHCNLPIRVQSYSRVPFCGTCGSIGALTSCGAGTIRSESYWNLCPHPQHT
jgi:hypothetical protein